MVGLDYKVIMRCVGLLERKQYPELKLRNEDLLPRMKLDIEDGKAYEVLAGLFNSFAP